jgi:hypothetical protein
LKPRQKEERKTIKEEENFLFRVRENRADMLSFSLFISNLRRQVVLQETAQLPAELVTLDKLL